jgi:hypothetical protein
MKSLSLRLKLWGVVAVAALVYYGARATHLPTRTDVGVERRLFAGSGYTLHPYPGSGNWMVVPPPPAIPTGPAAVLTDRLRSLEWPGGGGTGRKLAPYQPGGTWLLTPWGMRRVWRHRAETVHGDRYLEAGLSGGFNAEGEHVPVLDLRSRRTLFGTDAARALRAVGTDSDDYEEGIESPYPEWESGLNQAGLPLEGMEAEAEFDFPLTLSDREITLRHGDAGTPGADLYAVADGPGPAILRLAKNAVPLAVSNDGRILFFERDGALWRLDLRRPLPELLDEEKPPPLPLPTE